MSNLRELLLSGRGGNPSRLQPRPQNGSPALEADHSCAVPAFGRERDGTRWERAAITAAVSVR